MHQRVVDAYAAQYADERTKPMAPAFALAGLYLHVELAWTGRRVQLAHMQMARSREAWPPFQLPAKRGATTPCDVVATAEDPEREVAIDRWCASVWSALAGERDAVVAPAAAPPYPVIAKRLAPNPLEMRWFLERVQPPRSCCSARRC